MGKRVTPRVNHQGEVGPSSTQPEWSDLFGRLADSLSRLIRAEVSFAESRVKHAVSGAISNAALRIAAIVLLAITGWLGLVCLLFSYILLLHQWMRWWQAVGAGGVTIILIGLILFLVLNASARRKTTD
jgi:Putative Actinobacterial Holin-X, holin superfamily III